MSLWTDFNNAEDQDSFDVIPKGTLVKVSLRIRPGGFDDPEQGWTGGYATRNPVKGSVYLNVEYTVLEGPYARRKIWGLIGLHSPKGPEWTNMGRKFVKSLLNSAHGLQPSDHSPQAQQKRCIHSFADLEGMEFVAKVDVEKDQNDNDKNVIKAVITPDHKRYAELMGTVAAPASVPAASAPATPSNPAASSRPAWAQ